MTEKGDRISTRPHIHGLDSWMAIETGEERNSDWKERALVRARGVPGSRPGCGEQVYCPASEEFYCSWCVKNEVDRCGLTDPTSEANLVARVAERPLKP